MTVYLINHCNAWHEYSSFRLIAVVSGSKLDTTLNKIKKKLKYTDEDMDTYIDIDSVELNDTTGI